MHNQDKIIFATYIFGYPDLSNIDYLIIIGLILRYNLDIYLIKLIFNFFTSNKFFIYVKIINDYIM